VRRTHRPVAANWTGLLFLATALVVAVQPACEKDDPGRSPQVQKEEGFIAFVGAGQDDPLWPVLRAGAHRFDRAHGRVEVRYEAPPVVSPTSRLP